MSRLILAVDTTSEYGSLALLRDEELIDEVLVHAPKGFAHLLYGHLAELLGRHALKIAEIACFAAASGPGSFTGVRVGLACVKGLAEAVSKQLGLRLEKRKRMLPVVVIDHMEEKPAEN